MLMPLTFLLVESVRNGGGRRLVDNAHNVETSNGSSILRRLALSIVEVGGDSDHGILHFLNRTHQTVDYV